MVKRFVLFVSLVGALTTVPFAAPIDLLSSDNMFWSASVGNSTCIIAPRSSGDSLSATWKVDSGGWSTTWVAILGSLATSLSGADSLKITYKNNNPDGYTVRLTLTDATMWEPPLTSMYLNAMIGKTTANFSLDSFTFKQFKFAATDADGIYSTDKIKSISFINNTNPNLLTSAGVSGVFTVYQMLAAMGATSVRPNADAVSRSIGSIRISPDGISVPRGGAYTVCVYSANGAVINVSRQQYAAGFNKVNFSQNGSGVFIAKVSGNGFAGSGRLVIR
jgi:hypothetical protein